jgi:hypothetical protein
LQKLINNRKSWRGVKFTMAISVKEIEYKEYGKCVEISNGTVDVVVTVDVGPRIIRFGFIGGENELCEAPGASQPIGGPVGGVWKIKGGHRLWHSPENMPRTYIPDDNSVEWCEIDNGIKVRQKIEPWAQIEKEMEITLAACCDRVRIVHRLTNRNAWPVEFSVWALTVVAPGGKEIIPQPRRDTGLLGNRVIALWPYSKMNDHRIYWGDKYIVLQQDPNTRYPFKFGINNEDGWAAYFNHGNLFIKRYIHQMGAKYPDFGVSYETYTTDFMLEMESLSPLTLVEPNATLSHVEEWELIGDVEIPSNDEAEIDRVVKEHIVCCSCDCC